jgi:hypothetical protein
MASSTLAVMADGEFESLLRRFCRLVVDAYSREPRLIRAIGDIGSLFTVAVIVAKQGGRGVTLADVQRVICNRLASPRRVRAIVDGLERTHAVTRTMGNDDFRRRQVVISGWLPHALMTWGNAYARSASAYLSAAAGTPLAANLWAMQFLSGWAEAYERFNFLIADGYPVVLMLTDHFAGHPMLLQMIGSAVLLPDGTAVASLSRKAAARSFGLSRAHFTMLLAKCERFGWMTREGKGTRIVMAEHVYRELRSWVAREIAWVVEVMGGHVWMPEEC